MSVASGPKLGGLCRFFVVDFFYILMFEVSESCRAFFFFSRAASSSPQKAI